MASDRFDDNGLLVNDGSGPASRPSYALAPRVLIESPFKGLPQAREYLGKCVRDCIARGEAPYASHGFFTQWLDDNNPEERAIGIELGLVWGKAAQLTAVYIDHGISGGMQLGIERARAEKRRIVYRQLSAPDTEIEDGTTEALWILPRLWRQEAQELKNQRYVDPQNERAESWRIQALGLERCALEIEHALMQVRGA